MVVEEERREENRVPIEQDTTDYLLSSPANARRLLESMAQFYNGGGKERDLIEP